MPKLRSFPSSSTKKKSKLLMKNSNMNKILDNDTFHEQNRSLSPESQSQLLDKFRDEISFRKKQSKDIADDIKGCADKRNEDIRAKIASQRRNQQTQRESTRSPPRRPRISSRKSPRRSRSPLRRKHDRFPSQ
eukprot:747799_1